MSDKLFRPEISEERERDLLKQAGGSGLSGLINKLIPGQTSSQKTVQAAVDARQSQAEMVAGLNPNDAAGMKARADELLATGGADEQRVAGLLHLRAGQVEKTKTAQEKLNIEHELAVIDRFYAVDNADAANIKASAQAEVAKMELTDKQLEQEAFRIVGNAKTPSAIRQFADKAAAEGKTQLAFILNGTAQDMYDKQKESGTFLRSLQLRVENGRLTPEEASQRMAAFEETKLTDPNITGSFFSKTAERVIGLRQGMGIIDELLGLAETNPSAYGPPGALRSGFQELTSNVREITKAFGRQVELDPQWNEAVAEMGGDWAKFDPEVASVRNLEIPLIFTLAQSIQNDDDRTLKISIQMAEDQIKLQGLTSVDGIKAQLQKIRGNIGPKSEAIEASLRALSPTRYDRFVRALQSPSELRGIQVPGSQLQKKTPLPPSAVSGESLDPEGTRARLDALRAELDALEAGRNE